MVDLPQEVKDMATRQTPDEGGRGGERMGWDRSGDRGPRGPRGPRPPRAAGGPPSGGPMGRGGLRPQRRRRRLFGGGKVCQFCARKIHYVDYKDVQALRFFISSEGKILPRRFSGACARHQRMVTTAVKRARHLALLPFKAA